MNDRGDGLTDQEWAECGQLITHLAREQRRRRLRRFLPFLALACLVTAGAFAMALREMLP